MFGLHAKISVKVEVENESKMAGENNKDVIWALVLSLLALITSFQQQLVVLLSFSPSIARYFPLSLVWAVYL